MKISSDDDDKVLFLDHKPFYSGVYISIKYDVFRKKMVAAAEVKSGFWHQPMKSARNCRILWRLYGWSDRESLLLWLHDWL